MSKYRRDAKKMLLFDTETTGIPVEFSAPITDTYNWPRVIQIAWQLAYEDTGEVLREFHSLIKPDGWRVPTGDFWVEHGYSTEKCEKEGLPMSSILPIFIAALKDADILVAHNLAYDLPVIQCEMYRYGVSVKTKLKKYCTKEESTEICKLPARYGKHKWPTLSEAYRFFYKKDFDGAHDALADVKACKEVYLAIQCFNSFL